MLGFLKPAEGCTVDQEDGRPWPAVGMDAPNTLFVRRRIACGDLVEAERPVAVSPIMETEGEQPAVVVTPESEGAGGEQLTEVTETETPPRSRRTKGDK
ncbi:hypothetical protein B5K08_15830 [Rhizobium leguminosarum bv. trifolii]|uniref:DUF2635 domain-containing protein n=2 Tax=Rhizobium leguminosarum TaxID=384 RepID=A0A3E1BHP4_RHILT|nr:hypothetical protein B5K08_15830 [Rhizobium leguminosarum bv. trifolii]RFB92547.1 hypothetical protein B5K10_15825 [Rhizobium leguminosarum bv. trifolii]